jgi:uncharacterized protein YyaL (SSP411 family)
VIAGTFAATTEIYGRTTGEEGMMADSGPRPLRIADSDDEGGGHKHTNRLIHETSPYLLQHAHNPVDWWPWGPEALQAAGDQDKPIFLSVGYSTCHWCHVMERESFEDEQIARRLNESFIPVKVDREERPDVDKIYMQATQMLTGQGGWPNSVFLTPDGQPFFAGTYFPPNDRYGRPGFLTLLTQLAAAWGHRRQDMLERARQVSEALCQYDLLARTRPGARSLSHQHIQAAVDELDRQYDTQRGGFGQAPKFPPHGQLRLILQQLKHQDETRLGTMLTGTLDAMARGGIYDHVGGGFHRYSTDADWFLPHFEKMLYDNAQLAWIYAEAWSLIPEPRYRRVATQTCDWVLDDMTDPRGGFYSARDADSEGQEGKFYLWTREELDEVLPGDKARFFRRAFGVMTEGNFRDPVTQERPGSNVLYRAEPCDTLSKDLEIRRDKLQTLLTQCLLTLRETRSRRPAPQRDEKVLAAWNAMMISALVKCGQVFDTRRYTDAAIKAAQFILAEMVDAEGRLLRSWRDGQARLSGYLEDYALLAGALLDLHEATGESSWLERSVSLAQRMVETFAEGETGEFYFTPPGDEHLLMRPRDWLDNATPSPAGWAVLVLARLGRAAGRKDFAQLADKSLQSAAGLIAQAPTAVTTLVLAARIALEEPEGEASPAQLAREVVAIKAEPPSQSVQAGSSVSARVTLEMEDGWHVYGPARQGGMYTPTDFRLSGDEQLRLGGVEYPPAEDMELGDARVPVYHGQTRFDVEIRTDKAASPGEHEARLTVRYQPCRDMRCLEPVEATVDLRLDITAGKGD